MENDFERDERQERPNSWWRVVAPSLAFAGVQASWAVQIGHGSAHLRKLGLKSEWVGLAWLAGPVTGILVQPLVGNLSDNCTSRYGKRKPFMLVGAIGMFLGLLIFSNSGNIAGAVGDPVVASGAGSKTGLAIAVISFWVVDAFTNMLQGPARTLLGDLAPMNLLSDGNAYMAAANGVGKVIGYTCGAFTSRIEIVYGITGLIALLLTLISLTVDEGHIVSTSTVKPKEVEGSNQTNTCLGFAKMSPTVLKAFAVQSFAYFSFMIFFVYGSVWVGKEVMNGAANAPVSSPEHARFVEGVSLANRGFLVMAFLSIIISLGLPVALRTCGYRSLWSLSLVLLGVAMICAKIVTRGGVYGFFASIAMSMSCSMTIPWTIVSVVARTEGKGENLGKQMATFNLSQSISCLVAAIAGSVIVKLGNGDISNVFVTGGVAALMGAVLVWWTDIPFELQERQ